jgi:hypothetical protein
MPLMLTLLGVVIFYAAMDIAKHEKKPIRVEIEKLFISIIVVFGSVYGAQYLSTKNQHEMDIEHSVNLLSLSANSLESFNELLARIPQEYERAYEATQGGYSVKNFFEDNPIFIPKVLEVTLSDTDILRVMHPQSVGSIYSSVDNLNTAINALNKRNIQKSDLREIIEKTRFFTKSTMDFIDFDLNYQTGKINEHQLTELHIKYNIELNKHTSSDIFTLEP